jgi:hypothetical protein
MSSVPEGATSSQVAARDLAVRLTPLQPEGVLAVACTRHGGEVAHHG